MAPLVANAADEVWHLYEIAEWRWPVRNREAGVIAGDQGSSSDHDERRARHEDGESVMCGIVFWWTGFQKLLPGSAGWSSRFQALRAVPTGLSPPLTNSLFYQTRLQQQRVTNLG